MRVLFSTFCAIVICFCFAVRVEAGERKLPEPKKTGGQPVLEAIDQRGSAGQDFPTGAPAMEDMATVLWAATGHNRDGAK